MHLDKSPLARRLDAKLARYIQWEKPLRTYRGQHMRRVSGGGLSWDEFDRGLRALEAALLAEYDPWVDLAPMFEQLCTAYLDGDAAARAAIREFAAHRRALGELLWRYANRLRGAITQADDGPMLTRALAAVSIENCGGDYRDTLMTLADLYVGAEEAGIDPQPSFAAVAELSTDEPTAGGCESLARMLREFHGYSVLRERRQMGQPYGGPA